MNVLLHYLNVCYFKGNDLASLLGFRPANQAFRFEMAL